jgi:GNAT superfamily N-acetyltransferase
MNSSATKDRADTKWNAVPYQPLDLPAVARFFKRNYSGPGSYGSADLFHWKLSANVTAPGILNLVKDGDEIVCTMSVVPKKALFKGSGKVVAEIGDIYTEPAYQRQGMFALLARRSTADAEARGIHFIYGLPNQQALPGWEKRGNFKIMSGVQIKSLVVPLDIKPLLQKDSRWLMGHYASSLFLTMMWVYFAVRKAIVRIPASLTVEEVTAIPPGWGDFWDEAKAPFDFILSRDRETMHWRYFLNPNRYRFYILREGRRITGYLVYRIIFDPAVTVLVIADYLSLPGREKDLRMLLFKVIHDAAIAGVTKVNAWCTASSGYIDTFKGFGFIERSDIPIISFQNDYSRSLQDQFRRWHFTVGDSDNV